MKVTAGRAADPQTFALLYPQANPMTIGGKFTIEKGGKFTPVTDILTGNPVFVTARVFDLQDEGMVDATGMGYGVALLDGECPEGARSYTAAGYTYYLYAPGCYPGYGTSAGAYGISLGRGGTAYGYAYAPWLPGSPGGIYNGYFNGYNWQTGTYEQHPEYLMFLNGGWGRGGGAIRIHATDMLPLWRGRIEPLIYTPATRQPITYAFGAACDQRDHQNTVAGPGYGGNGDRPRASCGHAYGYRYAPFLPGSCGISDAAEDRGGGAIWIDSAGQFTLLGTLDASGAAAADGRSWTSTGGGIWIGALGFTAGPNAAMLAPGGSTPGVSYGYGTFGAAGGRIALAIGVSNAEKAALARGEMPASLTYEDTITLVATDVTGGEGAPSSGSVNYRAGDGTCATVRGTLTGTTVHVTGAPVEALSEGALYGNIVTSIDQMMRWSRTATRSRAGPTAGCRTCWISRPTRTPTRTSRWPSHAPIPARATAPSSS